MREDDYNSTIDERQHEFDPAETFEPIRKSERGNFPNSNERKARRSSKETYASRKVRKAVSSNGGMHRRRRKTV